MTLADNLGSEATTGGARSFTISVVFSPSSFATASTVSEAGSGDC